MKATIRVVVLPILIVSMLQFNDARAQAQPDDAPNNNERAADSERDMSARIDALQAEIDRMRRELNDIKAEGPTDVKTVSTQAEDDWKSADAEAEKSGDPKRDDGFHFGTYGRIQASYNADGEPGKSSNVVAHGARLMEGPYLEFDFGYTVHTEDGFGVRVLATLAFFEEFFHYSGQREQNLAMRNLYAEAENFIPGVDLKLWVGSRMYRGDDIYLVDFWPMDNLNTVGGGVQYDNSFLRVKWHVGVNRLMNEYQFRSIAVPAPFGADEITVVDRQRLISSLKITGFLFDLTPKLSMKLSLYGELHYLPDGAYHYSEGDRDYFETFGIDVTPGERVGLPQDMGGVIGAQVGFWGFAPNSHLNLFFRYAWDLAAYGEWGVPWGTTFDRTAKGAKEMLAALSFNWESHWVGVMAGWYARYFEDADRNTYDLDDYWEGIAVVRPAIFITRHFHQMFEVSHQWRRPNGLGPNQDRHLIPQVWQFSVMPSLSMDRGMYHRPQFRLVYTASHQNWAARNLYPMFDARRDKSWQHYIGVQVEWWLDSSSYQ